MMIYEWLRTHGPVFYMYLQQSNVSKRYARGATREDGRQAPVSGTRLSMVHAATPHTRTHIARLSTVAQTGELVTGLTGVRELVLPSPRSARVGSTWTHPRSMPSQASAAR